LDVARYVVDAVVLEGRSCREVAGAHGISKSWVAKLVARYRSGGYEAIAPRSKAARRVANRSSEELEERVVRLRKELTDHGFDAGAQTIHYHLALGDCQPPSVSTIWRILKRRGFVTPQPHKRPKSSYLRFEAQLPNQTWQADVTCFELQDGAKVEILNLIDDFSRVCVASRVLQVTTSPDVVQTLYEAGGAWGLPASLLSDNGCIFTATHRYGFSAFESELFHLGIACNTRAPITRRRAARSSASTRPSRSSLTSSRGRSRSPSCKPRSMVSSPTTTRSVRTAPRAASHPRWRSTRATKLILASWIAPHPKSCACVTTRST
jgi:transposase